MTKSSESIMITAALFVAVALSFILWLGTRNNNEQQESPSVTETVQIEPSTELSLEKPVFQSLQAQEVIDEWVAELPTGANASVAVLADDGEQVASHNPGDSYFAASIYKLYVAYAGYQALDGGLVDEEALYVGNNTWSECLDLMIRESDSPCAEKMWNELGKDSLTQQLIGYGIENTNMAAVTSTADDAAKMLVRISLGTELSESSQQDLLESMKTQIYRDALNAGFSDDIVVYNKVGFNLNQEYHDVAIIELEDGRRAVVSVFTSGVGPSSIAELAKTLETTVQK